MKNKVGHTFSTILNSCSFQRYRLSFRNLYSILLTQALWVGMSWYGLVWVGMGLYGLVWDGMGWYGLVWAVTAPHHYTHHHQHHNPHHHPHHCLYHQPPHPQWKNQHGNLSLTFKWSTLFVYI